MNKINRPRSDILRRTLDRGYLVFDDDKFGIHRAAHFEGTDEEFAVLCEVDSLHELHCDSSLVTDISFGKVTSLRNVRVLSVPFTKITGCTFSAIEALPDLEELHCNPREHTDLAAASI